MSFIVKITTILNPLELIAPHSCRGCGHLGSVLCDRCKKYIIPCQNDIKDLPPVFCIGERKGVLALLIHDFKYHSVRAIGVKLAELLNESLPQDLSKDAIIVPLPTSTKHIRERGFDHTVFIAKRLAKLRHIKTENLLLRAKNTVQVGADKATRITQANSAYTINPKLKINPNKTYLLLDDVWTTGASMRAALKKLREAGAKNFIIVLLAVSRLD